MRILFFILFIITICNSSFPQADSSCITSQESKRVTGTSMEGLIPQGSTVVLLYGFYKCNTVQRNDVVAYDYSGYSIPLIKLAKGIPGDDFYLKPLDASYHCIVINGDTLRDLSGSFYKLKDAQYRLLHLYEKDYHNKIPADSYLLLGTKSNTLDSGRYGLIGKNELLGKIIYKKQ